MKRKVDGSKRFPGLVLSFWPKSFVVLLSCWFLVLPLSACFGEYYWEFGEEIRSISSWTKDAVKIPLGSSTCELCDRPTLFGRKRCFRCLRKQFPHDFTEWAKDALDASKEGIKKIGDPNFQDELINKIFEAKRHLQDSNKLDSNYERVQQRKMAEQFLNSWKDPSGKPLNEIARETIQNYFPALEGTDYSEDPVKTLSYFLILDGKGFIKDVRCVRGPMGQPMTLLEAYEHYSRTDPKKAEDILELIDNVRKLSDPKYENEKTTILLDSIGRSLRILLK